MKILLIIFAKKENKRVEIFIKMKYINLIIAKILVLKIFCIYILLTLNKCIKYNKYIYYKKF